MQIGFVVPSIRVVPFVPYPAPFLGGPQKKKPIFLFRKKKKKKNFEILLYLGQDMAQTAQTPSPIQTQTRARGGLEGG